MSQRFSGTPYCHVKWIFSFICYLSLLYARSYVHENRTMVLPPPKRGLNLYNPCVIHQRPVRSSLVSLPLSLLDFIPRHRQASQLVSRLQLGFVEVHPPSLGLLHQPQPRQHSYSPYTPLPLKQNLTSSRTHQTRSSARVGWRGNQPYRQA